jgi:uncharacterized surface protein with fasciclin (FAS1) repeats
MLKRSFMIAATAFALVGCATTPAPTTITDTVARDPQLSTLSKLLAEAGLADTLRGAGPYTLFAPTDEAFKAVPAKTMADLAANKEALRSVLGFHVLPGSVRSTDVKVGSLKSVQGANLAVASAGSMLTVEDAVVIQADVAATNGVIHVIDRVLTPPKK